MSDHTCAASAGPYLIGYRSQYDVTHAGYSYLFGRGEHDWALVCPEEFRRGDVVRLAGIDHDRRLIRLERDQLGNVQPLAALMLVSPGYPLDPAADYEFVSHGCVLIDNWRVETRGNLSFVSLVGVPLMGRSTLIATRVGAGERFQYTFRGADHGN